MLRDESGSVTAATAVLLPGILIGMAMLFDLLWLNNHRSHLQAQADMAALEAARYTGERPSAVRQARVSVAVNDSFRAERLASRQIELGRWQDGSFSDMDVADPRRPNAARVTVRSEAKTNLTALLRRGFDAPFERKAVARAQERVSFTLSNCLASLDLFQGALRPLLGSAADLLCSDGALSLRANLLLETLALDLEAPLTYGDVLDAEIGLARLWSLALGADVPAPPGTIRLGDVLQLDEANRGLLLGAGLPAGSVSRADLIFASLELLDDHLIDLDFEADLGPFARVPVSLTVLEPRRIVLDAEPGSAEAYAETAQIRLGVDGLNLLGLVELDLALELAQASAQLSTGGSVCRPVGPHPAAAFTPVEAGLATLDIGLSALGLTVRDRIALVQSGAQTLSFSAEDVRDGVSKSLSPRLEGALDQASRNATELLGQIDPTGLSGLAGGLLAAASSLTAPLEAALASVVHDFVGLAIAPASLTVLEGTCKVRLVQ